MGANVIIKRMKEAFADITGANRFGREDAVLLKTALMLAAVDGEVSESEVSSFRELASKCRGFNGASFEELWDGALRSAGYLMLQSRFLGRDELVATFVNEAEKDFVGVAALETSEERHAAFRLFERMAAADGEYSEIERACLDALSKRVEAAWKQSVSDRYPRAAAFDRCPVPRRP